MALHFYSSTGGVIHAATGVNAVVLPSGAFETILGGAVGPSDRSKMESSFRSAISSCPDDYLPEELHHHRVVWGCRTAQQLRVAQLLVGVAYCNRTQAVFRRAPLHRSYTALEPAVTYQNVVRLYEDYSRFHRQSYPLIEAHYQVMRSNGRPNDTAEPPLLYKDQYEHARNELSNARLTEAQISNLIDARMTSPRVQLGIGGRGGNQELSRRPPRRTSILAAVRQLLPAFLDPCIHGYLARLALTLPKNVLRHASTPLRTIAAGPSYDKGHLPKIICGDVTIDPSGFADSELAPAQQDSPFSKPQDKTASDLLWYLLARVTVSNFLLSEGLSLPALLSYWSKLRDFYRAWRPAIEGRVSVIEDADAAASIETHARSKALRTEGGRARRRLLVGIATALFKEIYGRRFDELQDERTGMAVNCGYMRI